MELREWSWGTLSPKPPGIYRLGLLQQKGGPDDPPGGRSPGGSHPCCLQIPDGARVASLRCPILRRNRRRPRLRRGEVFPVSVTLGVPGVGIGDGRQWGHPLEVPVKTQIPPRTDKSASSFFAVLHRVSRDPRRAARPSRFSSFVCFSHPSGFGHAATPPPSTAHPSRRIAGPENRLYRHAADSNLMVRRFGFPIRFQTLGGWRREQNKHGESLFPKQGG